MTIRRQPQHFRRYQRARPSNWRLLPWILLGAFDVGLVGYLVHGLWVLWR